MLKTKDFYYDLPEELIAQHPCDKRENSRMMVLNKVTGEIEHDHFYNIKKIYKTHGHPCIKRYKGYSCENFRPQS